MNDYRWTGREGEKIFSLLCSRRRTTCIKADEDDRGWDFIIHYPPPSMVHVPTDRRSAGATALVQIKATTVGAERWSTSLKNALSLAKSPLPAFMIRVGVDDSGRESFRCIHIWGDEIARILKAARQAYVDGDEALNRRTIAFDFNEGTEREDVLAWMLGEIDRIGESGYSTVKQKLVDTLGYEAGRGVARLRLSTPNANALIDLQLGLIDGLDVEHFSFTPRRFGIESAEPEIEVVGGRLEITPRGREGAVRLRAHDGQLEIVPAEVFSASLPGGRRTKTRFKAGFLDFVVSSKGRFTVKCSERREESTTLDRIAALALLRRSTKATPITVGFRTIKGFAEPGSINSKRGGEPGWEQLLFITQSLRRLAAYEGIDPPRTSIDAMTEQFVELSVLDALISGRSLRMEFTPLAERDGDVRYLLAYASVLLDGRKMGAVASRSVTADCMHGARRRIDFGPATILHAVLADAGAADLRKTYLDELDRLSETGDVLAIGDLQVSAFEGNGGELTIDEPRRMPSRRLVAT